MYYRKVRALLGLQLFDEAKRAIEPLLERCQEVSATHNEIVDRFRRIIETDIPRAQRKAEGHYDMLDAHVEEADEFAAEFDRAEDYEFRPCETPVWELRVRDSIERSFFLLGKRLRLVRSASVGTRNAALCRTTIRLRSAEIQRDPAR